MSKSRSRCGAGVRELVAREPQVSELESRVRKAEYGFNRDCLQKLLNAGVVTMEKPLSRKGDEEYRLQVASADQQSLTGPVAKSIVSLHQFLTT